METADIIQIVVAFITAVALCVAICDIKQNKKQFEIEMHRLKDQELRSQAEQIAVWFEDNEALEKLKYVEPHSVLKEFIVRNDSELPIYSVIITEVGRIGAGPPCCGEERRDIENGSQVGRSLFVMIPPGQWGQLIKTGGNGMSVHTTLEIAFTDAKGNNWIRRGNGRLVQVTQDLYELYGISLPPMYQEPIRLNT